METYTTYNVYSCASALREREREKETLNTFSSLARRISTFTKLLIYLLSYNSLFDQIKNNEDGKTGKTFVVHVVGRQYEIEDHVARVIEGK